MRTAAFTPQQLATAWQHYINEHPTEIILLSAMRNSEPQRIDDNTYFVEVENNAQIEAINSNMTKLMQFLRNEVGNDMLALEVRLGAKGVSVMAKTDRELVEDMRRRNPQFNQMVQDFQLSLV